MARRIPKKVRPIRRAAINHLATTRARNDIIAAIGDLKEDIAFNTYETAAVHHRLDTLEPTLKTLEQERQRRIGVVKFLGGGRVWGAVFIGAAGWVWHFLSGTPTPPILPPHP